MIIVQLQGGLGNQLFQYSLGRFLAEKNATSLKLDIGWYGTVPDRPYELDKFSIVSEIATPKEIISLRGKTSDRARRLLKLKVPSTVITEPSLVFHPEILEVGPDAYLEGYWQSEKYFKDIAPIITQELTVKAKPTGENARLLDEMSACTAVCLHVRRGDYVLSKAANQFHGTCSLDYYADAVAHIASKVKNPHFYIFSDDPTWTKENLLIDFRTTFITHNGSAAEQDLRLMNACKHFIIANSTFSWWGAWLATSKEKIVIAPKIWFQSGQDSTSLVPADWTRI